MRTRKIKIDEDTYRNLVRCQAMMNLNRKTIVAFLVDCLLQTPLGKVDEGLASWIGGKHGGNNGGEEIEQ